MRTPVIRVVIYLLALVVGFGVPAVVGAHHWVESNCGSSSFAGECSGAPIEGVFWGLFTDGGIVVMVLAVEAYFRISSRTDDHTS